MVKRLKALGGLHSLEDFAEAAGEYVEPVRASYRGVEVCQIPPNNQGLTALLMLNILSGFDVSGFDPLGAPRLHLEIEAGRLAYRDRDALIADPTKVAGAGGGAALGPLCRAPQGRDRSGDAGSRPCRLPCCARTTRSTSRSSIATATPSASSTRPTSPSAAAWSRPKSGVVLQNRGASFRLDPAHPNRIEPGKRPMHTIMPGMALKDGRALMPFGVMGGDFQPFGHVHFLTNLLDFAMDPQAALDAARVFPSGEVVEAERGVSGRAIAGLQDRGHQVMIADEPHGGGQAILIDWEAGTLTAGSDPRKDGCALGY